MTISQKPAKRFKNKCSGFGAESKWTSDFVETIRKYEQSFAGKSCKYSGHRLKLELWKTGLENMPTQPGIFFAKARPDYIEEMYSTFADVVS